MNQVLKPDQLAKIPVKEMTLVQLAWAYAQLTGMTYIYIDKGEAGHVRHEDSEYCGHSYWTPFRPHTDWNVVGRAIDQYDVQIKHSEGTNPEWKHLAKISGSAGGMGTGPTKLIAVVRTLVYMHLDGFSSMLVPTEAFIQSTIKED